MKSLEHAKARTVLAVGIASSGKSTVLNSLTNSKSFPVPSVGFDLTSQTAKTPQASINYTEVPDITRLTSSLRNPNYESIKGLAQLCIAGITLILYCYPITHVRCDSDMQKAMQFMRTIFKTGTFPVVLAFTFCGMLNGEELTKAKVGLAKEVKAFFEEKYGCSVVHTAYFNNGKDEGEVKQIVKIIEAEKRVVNAGESWENIEKYLEQERKENCEILLEFADIMEEEKKMCDLVQAKNAGEECTEIEDLPPDSLVKLPHETKAIQTKESITNGSRTSKARPLYLQKELAREKEKCKEKFNKLTSQPRILQKK